MAGPAKVNVQLPALNAQQKARLKSLENELRCLVCQNQTLAESSAELAGDLRNQVHKLVAQGLDDAQIKDYLVQRYGDFVLYKPPFKPSTAVLWAGPFGLLAVGAGAWFMIGRRRATVRQAEMAQNASASGKPNDKPADRADAAVSAQARQAAASLLKRRD